MDDSSDRLKEARIEAGFSSGRAAALALGIPPATYAAHENGTRTFNAETAQRYAKFFRVSASWLLLGVQDIIYKTGPDERTRVSFPKKQFQRGGLVGDENIPPKTATLLVTDTNKWDGKTIQTGPGAAGPETGEPEERIVSIRITEVTNEPALPEEEDAVEGRFRFRRTWSIPAPFIMEHLLGRLADMVMLEVTGDEMLHTLTKGTCLFVDLKQSSFVDEGLYVVVCEDGTFQPRRLQRPKGSVSKEIHIICDNKSYEDVLVEEDELEIMGKVIGIVAGFGQEQR